MGIPLVNGKAYLSVSLAAQAAGAAADNLRADPLPLKLFVHHEKADISSPFAGVIQNEIHYRSQLSIAFKPDIKLVRRLLPRRQSAHVLKNALFGHKRRMKPVKNLVLAAQRKNRVRIRFV